LSTASKKRDKWRRAKFGFFFWTFVRYMKRVFFDIASHYNTVVVHLHNYIR
jgi:hypothetical protein